MSGHFRRLGAFLKELKGVWTDLQGGFGGKEYELLKAKQAEMRSNIEQLRRVKAEREQLIEKQTIEGLRGLVDSMKGLDSKMEKREEEVVEVFDEYQRATEEMMEKQMKYRERFAKDMAKNLAKDVPQSLLGEDDDDNKGGGLRKR